MGADAGGAEKWCVPLILKPHWTTYRRNAILTPTLLATLNNDTTVPGIAAYLKETLAPNSVVGLDPTVHPSKFVKALAKALAAKDIRVRPLGACAFDMHVTDDLLLSDTRSHGSDHNILIRPR